MTRRLFDNLSYYTSANGTATFTNCEAETLSHCYWVNKGNNHLNVVTWHNHFLIAFEFDGTSDVGSSEVELWTVALNEWSMTTTFFLGKYVYF